MNRLDGKVALISGAARGIGAETARKMAAAGASVVLHGQDAQRLAAAAEAFREAGHEARSIRFDIADEAAILEAFAKLDAEGVIIDILVNNAGMQLRKPMLELSTQEWRKIIDANLTSAFIVAREAAKRMVPRGRGKIVNIGSLTSEVARATIAPYAVSKGGIKLLTRAMAAEWAAH